MILVTIPDVPEEYRTSLKNKYSDIFFTSSLLEPGIPYEKIEVLITYGFEINDDLFNKLPSLKWVQAFQTGVNHFPFEELKKRNITLTNLRGIYGTPISEYVMSYIFYFVRDIERYNANKRLKDYNREILPDEISGKTIVILGAGTIGKEIAKKAKFLGMNVIGVNTTGKLVDHFDEMYSFNKLNEVVSLGEFIITLFPVTDSTRHCITSKQFSLMKESAYFFNIGRAELIVEEDLIDCLRRGEIRGAILDVFKEEPLPKESPLWEIENLYITPHLSGKSRFFYKRGFDIFNKNYEKYKQNSPLQFTFDFEKGY